jgi:hypothetical protein
MTMVLSLLPFRPMTTEPIPVPFSAIATAVVASALQKTMRTTCASSMVISTPGILALATGIVLLPLLPPLSVLIPLLYQLLLWLPPPVDSLLHLMRLTAMMMMMMQPRRLVQQNLSGFL